MWILYAVVLLSVVAFLWWRDRRASQRSAAEYAAIRNTYAQQTTQELVDDWRRREPRETLELGANGGFRTA